MKQYLYYWDVYPKVFPVGMNCEITVKPLSDKKYYETGKYRITVHSIDSGSPNQPFTSWNNTEYNIEIHEKDEKYIKFTYNAAREGEYRVRIYKESPDGSWNCLTSEISVYALNSDLADKIPLRGDFHMHTCRSDGREDPATVCANYRAMGYDFIVVTDHGRYYPSLEAREIYSKCKIYMNIIPGEEVHMPLTDLHIVNAGGTFSVNAVLDSSPNYAEKGNDLKYRSLDGVTAPEMMTREQYVSEIKAIENGELCADCPENVNKTWFAVAVWVHKMIEKAGGLCIFAHPYWISDMFQIPEPLTFYLMQKHPFDAFEVLGGENYYEQNGFQTALYYEEWRQGRVHAIVGSTDSHGSTEHNRNRDICSTIVFAKENTREAIVDAVKERLTVAVDTISKEYRLVGEMRMQKYARFLLDNYFPLHDKIAALDGEIMLEYYRGEANAQELESTRIKSERVIKKYIYQI